MDKTQDIVIMIGYGPLLGGLLLAVALLAGSLYTQQNRLRGPLGSGSLKEANGPLKEAKVVESNGVEAGASAIESPQGDAQDAEGGDSAPDISYVKYYHDLPEEYCCDAMKRGVEELGFIEYYHYYNEYSFSSWDGYPLSTMMYCPYCGKERASLRALLSLVKTRYMRDRGWSLDHVYRYWGLYRRGRSQEEAEGVVERERAVEQERRSLRSQE